ncbi:hypothetical protein HOLleu_22126 [Holothuria leucospilota]|uniref:Uncharacterized protein n=1 Tax=Holothuria leucospilota TaxID=206669 RepID=A0A9Q1BYV2_HOLLE|nr:hypothetical protein HOLleu_22126 [Holothuria leucospilota]
MPTLAPCACVYLNFTSSLGFDNGSRSILALEKLRVLAASKGTFVSSSMGDFCNL